MVAFRAGIIYNNLRRSSAAKAGVPNKIHKTEYIKQNTYEVSERSARGGLAIHRRGLYAPSDAAFMPFVAWRFFVAKSTLTVKERK